MHELSIAHNIIEVVGEHLRDLPGCRVQAIKLRVGALSCVHPESLNFSFDLITADTPFQGAKLIIQEMPLVVYCPTCDTLRELPGIQLFECPNCGTLTGDIRQGKELEIDSIEVMEAPVFLSPQQSAVAAAEPTTRIQVFE